MVNIRSYNILSDKTNWIFLVTEKHLNKTTYENLKRQRISPYDVRLKDIYGMYKHLANERIKQGYSIVFKYGNKSKILIYNGAE